MDRFKSHRAGAVSHRVALLQRMNQALLDNWLEELGLRYGQMPFLCAVLECGGMSQDELAARASVSSACAARALFSLEETGFIIREENPDNRRQKLVHPTSRAREMQEALFEIKDRLNEQLLAGFGPEERALALEFLDRMLANAERGEGGAR
ncbi:MarR family winged helix-turn-helix transcriptional regulator [Desulfocurvus sp. DL9XJH121]